MNFSKMALPAALISLLSFALADTAIADNAAVTVHDDTTSDVTVNVDGQNGCEVTTARTCTIPVTVGHHTLTAVRHDNGNKRVEEVDVDANGYDWYLTEGNPR